MVLLLLFLSSFEWTELKVSDPKEMTSQIKQEIENNFSIEGKDVINRIVYLDEKVFSEGYKFLVPAGFNIKETPNQIELKKRYIKMVKYDRYSLTIKEGELESEWKRLKKEFESVSLNGRSIEAVSKNKAELKIFFPGLAFSKEESPDKGQPYGNNLKISAAKTSDGKRDYPEKIYFSFVLIGKGYQERIIPVILSLSPMRSLIEKIERGEE